MKKNFTKLNCDKFTKNALNREFDMQQFKFEKYLKKVDDYSSSHEKEHSEEEEEVEKSGFDEVSTIY